MRQLHVVAVSDDGQHLVLATTAEAATGGFRVAVDDRLRAALRGDLGRPGQRDVRVESALSPRQIQARLRSGESAEEVARAAGVPLKRIERFSGPVLGERAQVLEDARSATLSRARRGPSALPLGASVDLALGGVAGLRAESVTWTAGRREDGRWTVSLSYLARGRTKTVRWLWAPAERAVTALDPGASALGHVDELPAPRRAAPRARPAGAPGASPPARRRPARATSGGAKPLPRPTRGRAKASARQKTSVDAEPPIRALAVARPPVPAPEPVRRPGRPSGRASVPGWADILLGSAPDVASGRPADGEAPATKPATRSAAANGSPRPRRGGGATER